MFTKKRAIIGFLGYGVKFSGSILPYLKARFQFSVYILSFSIMILAGNALA